MELLVSVASAHDARAAVRGGAQIIDAKDPTAGALGAVTRSTLDAIRSIVPSERLMSAALGDAMDSGVLEQRAFEVAAGGAALVKVGLREVHDLAHLEQLVAAGVRGCERAGGAGLVAVVYADAAPSVAWATSMIDVAARTGARGVLVDTADKGGPGLLSWWRAETLEAWVAHAHERDLFACVAGRLDAEGLLRVRESGADVAGVRGAACEGGRGGRVSAARVRGLLRLLDGAAASSADDMVMAAG